MSRLCKITGKRPRAGNNVPFSQKKTRRVQYPNVSKRRLWVPELNRHITLRVSARGLKTLDKYGVMEYLRREGLHLRDIL